jgi:hypothetical protein
MHPKVGAGAVASAGVALVLLAVQQYAPGYAPDSALSAALTGFVSVLSAWLCPAA